MITEDFQLVGRLVVASQVTGYDGLCGLLTSPLSRPSTALSIASYLTPISLINENDVTALARTGPYCLIYCNAAYLSVGWSVKPWLPIFERC